MKKNSTTRTCFALTALAVMGLVPSAAAGTQSARVPARLPDPDTKPGDASKPVKVYILAGQSNMVGMGDLRGARNVYAGVYLGSDPAVPEGPFQIYRVGNNKTSKLQVYAADGSRTDQPVAKGQLEVPQRGVYRLHCGIGASSQWVMQLDGKEAYRRAAGAPPVTQDVTLKPGKRYGFEITGFTGTPPRFWLEKTDLLGIGDLEAVARREGGPEWRWIAPGFLPQRPVRAVLRGGEPGRSRAEAGSSGWEATRAMVPVARRGAQQLARMAPQDHVSLAQREVLRWCPGCRQDQFDLLDHLALPCCQVLALADVVDQVEQGEWCVGGVAHRLPASHADGLLAGAFPVEEAVSRLRGGAAEQAWGQGDPVEPGRCRGADQLGDGRQQVPGGGGEFRAASCTLEPADCS